MISSLSAKSADLCKFVYSTNFSDDLQSYAFNLYKLGDIKSAQEAEDIIENKLLGGVITNYMLQGRGRHKPEIIILDNNQWALKKKFVKTTMMRNSYKEVAVYLFDRRIRFLLSPVTLMRVHNREVFSYQAYLDGKFYGDYRPYKAQKSEKIKLQLFDYLIANRDRNLKYRDDNVLMNDKGELVAIDNEDSFHRDLYLSETDKKSFRRFLNSREGQAIHKQLYEISFNQLDLLIGDYLKPEEVEYLYARIMIIRSL